MGRLLYLQDLSNSCHCRLAFKIFCSDSDPTKAMSYETQNRLLKNLYSKMECWISRDEEGECFISPTHHVRLN